ncbi:MAG: hypothetical protein KIT84_34770 [Labilithrix sp.]|nr:hypothetical protein [Labilithrix sp.]MCW5816213.1 hypothetical protein [Labilithrix sp.]
MRWVATLGLVFLGAAGEARADDAPALPVPRLAPDLSLSKDKGVESAPQPDSWTTRPRAVSAVVGAPGSPLGIAALSLEYAPIKYLVLGTGGGFSPDGGWRASFMPRLRLPLNRWFAVGMGFPFTLGPYEYQFKQDEQCQSAGCGIAAKTTRSWPLVFWGQLEPNVELRISGAVALRLFGGYARVLNDESDRCTSTLPSGCPSRLGEQKWYGGLAMGYAW